MNKHFTLIPDINMSLLDADEKEYVYAVLKKHKVDIIKVLPSQRLAICNPSREQIFSIEKALLSRMPSKKGISVTYVQACPGLDQCKYAIADSLRIGRAIDQFTFNKNLPHKIKISIAGCSMCCTEPYVRDVGIIAKKKGWTVVFGGNAGGRPRIGDQIASNLTSEEAVALVKKCLDYYVENGTAKQRTARFIEQLGIDNFKNMII